MLENYVGARRGVPLHAPVQSHAAVENTAHNKDMQADAAASNSVQLHALPSPEEFTISVEQVREHFRSKGVHKSKDTVQRWCRTGELTCQKRGVLNRYFTTETSLKNLEAKILPDAIAETAGETKPYQQGAQPHAAAHAGAYSGTPVHEAEDAAARTGIQPDAGAAPPLQAGASDAQPDGSQDAARVMAENEGLREQLKSKDSEIEFLREEVRAARGQRGDVVQISNRMLETLETMAIGGRLDRPKPENWGDPVRYPPQNSEPGAV